ncbi:MAG: prepilin-type N-terminal cleavage/methylation domain-containing protein [Candidatus Omnitrophica bacterium]|nr:prepilin-type N-terminal cleavage/methylation domain-containing protein [Candidatus Omnitrophota bacterium]
MDDKTKNAFSLIEILITVIIVGIVASVAFTKFGVMVEKSHAKEGDQILYAMLTSQKRYAVEHDGVYATAVSQLDATLPALAYFAPPFIASGPQPRFAIIRNGSYTLSISSSGVVTCSGGPTGLCEKMGYDLTPGGPISPL